MSYWVIQGDKNQENIQLGAQHCYNLIKKN